MTRSVASAAPRFKNGSRATSPLMMAAARSSPLVRRNTSRAKAASSKAPTMAAVAYTGLNPLTGIETTKASHKMVFSTSAEPIPWTASARAASLPVTPSLVSRRYPRPSPPAVPPGSTWLTASVDRSILQILEKRLARGW